MPKKITEPKQTAGTVEVPVGYKILTAKVPYEKKASRLEALIIRWVWMIPVSIIATLYSVGFMIIIFLYLIAAGILLFFNWLSSFFLASRVEVAFRWAAKFIDVSVRYQTRLANYSLRRAPYFLMMTDKRPSLGMEEDAGKESGGSLA